MKKFCIKKTKGNIILLFVVGILIGIVIGLRQPTPEAKPLVPASDTALTQADASSEAEGAIKLGAETPVP